MQVYYSVVSFSSTCVVHFSNLIFGIDRLFTVPYLIFPSFTKINSFLFFDLLEPVLLLKKRQRHTCEYIYIFFIYLYICTDMRSKHSELTAVALFRKE